VECAVAVMALEGKKQPSAVALAPRCRFIVGVEEEFFCKLLHWVGTFLLVQKRFFWKAVGHVLLVMFFKKLATVSPRWWPQCRQGWLDAALAWSIFWWPRRRRGWFWWLRHCHQGQCSFCGNALPFFLSLLFSDVDFSFFTMLISFFNMWMHCHGLMCLKNPKNIFQGIGCNRQCEKNKNYHNQPECGDTPRKVHGDASGTWTCPGTWHSGLLQVFLLIFYFPMWHQ